MTPADIAAIEARVATVRAGAADFSLDPSSALLAGECEMLLEHIRTMDAEREAEIAAAVAKERERCAKVLDEMRGHFGAEWPILNHAVVAIREPKP